MAARGGRPVAQPVTPTTLLYMLFNIQDYFLFIVTPSADPRPRDLLLSGQLFKDSALHQPWYNLTILK
jgi:hypothetical protein